MKNNFKASAKTKTYGNRFTKDGSPKTNPRLKRIAAKKGK